MIRLWQERRRLMTALAVMATIALAALVAGVAVFQYSWIGHAKSEYTPEQIKAATGVVLHDSARIYQSSNSPNPRTSMIEVVIVSRTMPQVPSTEDTLIPESVDPMGISEEDVLRVVERASRRTFNTNKVNSYHRFISWDGPRSRQCSLYSVVVEDEVVLRLQWLPPHP